MYFELVRTPGADIEVMRINDRTPAIFVLPGASGGIRGYADLCERLTSVGLPAAGLNPRGCGGSTGSLEGLTMEVLAEDVACVIEAIGNPPCLIAGHAGGNRVARMVATLRPDLVRGVVLMAAGGKVPGDLEALRAMARASDPEVSLEARSAARRLAFVAPGNDIPDGWLKGEDRSAGFSRAFIEAQSRTPVDTWWPGGTAPILVLQGIQDRIAPPANGHMLHDSCPERVEVIDIDQAGHALVVEQPARITSEIRDWAARLQEGE